MVVVAAVAPAVAALVVVAETVVKEEAVKGLETEAKMAREKGKGVGAKAEACRAFQVEPGEGAGLTAGGAEAARVPRTVEARSWEEDVRDWEGEATD